MGEWSKCENAVAVVTVAVQSNSGAERDASISRNLSQDPRLVSKYLSLVFDIDSMILYLLSMHCMDPGYYESMMHLYGYFFTVMKTWLTIKSRNAHSILLHIGSSE